MISAERQNLIATGDTGIIATATIIKGVDPGRLAPFYDARLTNIPYVPDLHGAQAAGEEAYKRFGLNRNRKGRKRLAVLIDYQACFTQTSGSLYVQKAEADMARALEYIQICPPDGMMITGDEHPPYQIGFAVCWMNPVTGAHPGAFTVITHQSIVENQWVSIFGHDYDLQYTKHLEDTGQSPVCIWPIHGRTNTNTADWVAQFCEIIEYWSVVQRMQPIYKKKGAVAEQEHYGPFECTMPNGNPMTQMDARLLSMFEQYDIIDILGEAEDYCVKEAMRQVMKHFSKLPGVLQKIRFISNCTSLVFPDARAAADKFLDEMKTAGIRVVTVEEAMREEGIILV